MSQQEKLQRAVEATIAAGYQLSSEAFEFLHQASVLNDPTALINKALQTLEEFAEKPLFIDRSLLETLLKQPETKEQEERQSEKQESPPQEPLTEGSSTFHPYAKDVEAVIKIIEDPTTKLSANGTVEEYLKYFQDRFKRIERLLRQRFDVKSATSILEALKSPAKTKLKIIGMVTEKRESKQNIILTVEDLEGFATVLVSRKSSEELHKKAQQLLPDQVICLVVVKTSSKFFLAEDIIFPEVDQKPRHRASEPVYAVLTSDIHVGSAKFNREAFKRFILWLNGKYGNDKMREIASHVKYVLIAGDIIDGIGIYPNQMKELVIRDVYKQYKFASKLIERIPDYIEVLISPGNHDTPRKALPQPAISGEFLEILQTSKRIHSLGSPCVVSLHNVEILMYHGRSLDDIIATVPGLSHEHPEKAMKLLLQSRHLAPVYGGKTLLSPEPKDFLVIERVPDIFHAGHVHVVGHCNHRGVLIVNSGCWQEQTEYMQKLGLNPTPGKVPVVNLQTLATTFLSFV
ncbi:MAG: DNA-directed DNA polymerase II small subunit [Candidatus Bathyarchaeota archaeon]|nr:DNA-directed DNA polymerase II small subunit [Candidatus Bathyarchaeota archaeon]